MYQEVKDSPINFSILSKKLKILPLSMSKKGQGKQSASKSKENQESHPEKKTTMYPNLNKPKHLI